MKTITPVVLLGLTGLLLYFALVGPHGYSHLLQTKKESLALEKKSESLDKEMRDLRRQIEALKENPVALEKHAREKVDFAKPGETVYIFPSHKPE